MPSDPKHSSSDQVATQQRFLSLFLRSEREVFRYVAALVPGVAGAELGNWNPGDIPNKPPFLIRHFSGSMDEFAVFSRALNEAEIRRLYTNGKSQPDPERVASGNARNNGLLQPTKHEKPQTGFPNHGGG